MATKSAEMDPERTLYRLFNRVQTKQEHNKHKNWLILSFYRYAWTTLLSMLFTAIATARLGLDTML